MSRGPGKLQRAIFDVLASGRSFKTAELLTELVAFGAVAPTEERKVDLGRVLRACHGLREREVISMTYVPDGDVRKTCLWFVSQEVTR
jgi:hypothetical protein